MFDSFAAAAVRVAVAVATALVGGWLASTLFGGSVTATAAATRVPGTLEAGGGCCCSCRLSRFVLS